MVEGVETNHSIPFFPAWDDPAIEASKEIHPSNYTDRWTKPWNADRAPMSDRNTISDAINAHPRKDLLREWVAKAVEGGIDHQCDTYALSHALLEFASIRTDEWLTEPLSHDEQLSVFLDGTLRALGYNRGLLDLGRIHPDDAPNIMSAAFAITAGTGMLLYQEDGTCIFRANIHRA